MALVLEKKSIKAAVGKLKPRTHAFIGGKSVPAASGKTFATENPATGKQLAKIAACDKEDVDRAREGQRGNPLRPEVGRA